MTDRQCAGCDRPFVPTKYSYRQRYCSDACRRRAWGRRRGKVDARGEPLPAVTEAPITEESLPTTPPLIVERMRGYRLLAEAGLPLFAGVRR